MILNTEKRVVVISDIHGNLKLLKDILKDANFNPNKDLLVFAGDYCDIGNKSVECRELLEENNAIMLWANHCCGHLIGQNIYPYDPSLDNGELKILKKRYFERKWYVAVLINNILISHAGFSNNYMFESLDKLVEEQNNSFHNEFIPDYHSHHLSTLGGKPSRFIDNNSIFWFRPLIIENRYIDPNNTPLKIVPQIAGHTPPEFYDKIGLEEDFVKESLAGFFLIDPKGKNIRYAVIEDNRINYIDKVWK